MFTELTKRNALRREAQLPLLDLRSELKKEEIIEAWREYHQARQDFEPERVRIRKRILDDHIARYGARGTNNAGGNWLIEAKIEKAFEAFLSSKGFRKPPPVPGQSIFYGQGPDD